MDTICNAERNLEDAIYLLQQLLLQRFTLSLLMRGKIILMAAKLVYYR